MGTGARRTLTAVVCLVLAGLASCAGPRAPGGEPTPSDSPEPTAKGSLYLSREDARTKAERQAGAAGRLVQCTTRLTGEFSPDDYEGGETGRTPEKGFQIGLDEGAFDGPQKGYTLERTEGTRALFTYRVSKAIKMAVIMHDGPALGAPSGWHMESYARCDISEFPRGAMGGNGLQIWSDEAGRPVPSYEVKSFGGGDCADGATMLSVLGEFNSYVRKPPADLLDTFFDEDWRPSMPLPPDAYDSGYHLEDQHLWFSADRHRAYVGKVGAAEVEMWPRTIQGLGCA